MEWTISAAIAPRSIEAEVMYMGPILVAFSAISLALGAALSVTPRQVPSGTVTCGSNQYDGSAIEAAIDAGVNDMNNGYYPG
jgi:hypothetical protein